MSSVVWTVENSFKLDFRKKTTFFKAFENKYNGHFGKIKNFSKPVFYNLNVFYLHEF